ncbi:MAG TPA: hypothetical protein VN442_05350 [Bryobacteraceae bacterium]|nr:hypothetical protein [Bryobacteraceae bacterium]
MRILFLIAALAAPVAYAAPTVIDRTAVAVGNDVITETEILEEIRLVAFLNGREPEFTPEARREAAERLVDQYLIRREMRIGAYDQPKPSEADAMLANLRQSRFRTDAEYRAALQRYNLTEARLKSHLLWQLTALRFTDQRFQAGLTQPSQDILKRLDAEAESQADRASSSAPPTPAPTAAPAQNVDQQLDQWLRQVRDRTRIVFMKEAFQ